MKIKAAQIMFTLLSTATGCNDIGPDMPWVPGTEITGPLRPEIVAPPMPAPPPEQLRVVTFNVHYGQDVEGIARAIRENSALVTADLLLLQEIESHPEEGSSRASRLAQALGMGFIYVPARLERQGTHGLALLSRHPVENLAVMQLPDANIPSGPPARIAMSCDLRTPHGSLRVINVHLDTRLNIALRIRQLRPVVVAQPSPVLIAGDFNTLEYIFAGGAVPLLPVDTAVGGSQADDVDVYMETLGYTSATRTFGTTLPLLGMGYRLDSIYVRGLGAGAGAVERDVDVSDHFPLWTDVK